MPQPLITGDHYAVSDIAEMYDGTVMIGYWTRDAECLKPVCSVSSYDVRTVGTIGDRVLQECTDCQVTPLEYPTGVKGVLSLHPDGYALCLGVDGLLHLWRWALGVWTLAAVGAAEKTINNAEPVDVGTFRLEMVSGRLFAVAQNYSFRAMEARGAALVPVVTAAPSTPPALKQYADIITNSREKSAFNRPFAVYWRGAWYYTAAGALTGTPYLLTYIGTRVAFGADWLWSATLISDGVRLFGIGRDAASYSGWSILTGADTFNDESAAGAVIAYDGRTVRRESAVDCQPFAARNTSTRIWMLGVNARDIHEASGGRTGTNWSTWREWDVKIYRLQRHDAGIAAVQVEAAAHPRPSLASVAVEAGGAAGADSPVIAQVAAEATTGTEVGDTPIIASVALESAALAQVAIASVAVEGGDADSSASVAISAVQVEAAAPPAGPGESEDVAFAVSTAAGGRYVAFRVVPRMALDSWADLRMMYRADAEGRPVDEWSSYTLCKPGGNVLLPDAATTVRLAIIKPVANAKPDFAWQLLKERGL